MKSLMLALGILVCVTTSAAAQFGEGGLLDWGGNPTGNYSGTITWPTNGTNYDMHIATTLSPTFPFTYGTIGPTLLTPSSTGTISWTANYGACKYGRNPSAPCSGILYDIPAEGCPNPNSGLWLCASSGTSTQTCNTNVTGSYSEGMSNPYVPTVVMSLTFAQNNSGVNQTCPDGLANTINITLGGDCSDLDGFYCTEVLDVTGPTGYSGQLSFSGVE